MSIFHHCSCGAPYSFEEWSALHCPGLMACDAGFTLDLRDCRSCRSTMAIVLRPVPLEIHEFLEETEGRDAA